ncbi:unnamed protein product [Symbiodinium sp. CCMP2456]|nr:unnamed protein product [Symbiodinium sp. CCMP2456]
MSTSLHLELSPYTPSFAEEKSGSSGRICCARVGPVERLYCRPPAMPDDWSFFARWLDESGACEINEATKSQCSELEPRSAIPFAVTGASRVSDNLPILPDSRGAGLAEGDLLLVDTAAWYHTTEIPALTDFSFSLAQDFSERLPGERQEAMEAIQPFGPSRQRGSFWTLEPP